ncbi:hypothetical protein, partial [Streptomyces sp. SID2119]
GTRAPLPAAPDLPPPACADAAGNLVVDLGGLPVVDRVERSADGSLRIAGTYAPESSASGTYTPPAASEPGTASASEAGAAS